VGWGIFFKPIKILGLFYTFVNVIQSVSMFLVDDNWNIKNKTLEKNKHQNIYVQLPKCMCTFTRRAQMPKGRCAFTGI
jgi:hypothetical protein